MSIRKALFVGIDYVDSSAELQNCGHDAKDSMNFLSNNFDVEESKILMDRYDTDLLPTRDNLVASLDWLGRDLNPGDKVWFHYSGHGSHTRDTSGDEMDGEDETLVPLDYKNSGDILDDELHELICAPVVASGAHLFAHCDECHSGTILDLCNTLREDKKTNEQTFTQTVSFYEPVKQQVQHYFNPYTHFHNWFPQYYDPYFYNLFSHQNRYVKKTETRSFSIDRRTRNGLKFISSHDDGAPCLEGEGSVTQWSGCKDDQTSADGYTTASGENLQNGAMTGCVLTYLRDSNMEEVTAGDFLYEIRSRLRERHFEQIPCLSSSNDSFNQKTNLFANLF